jgi:hypothetical protein
MSPTEVADAVKTQFNVELTRQQVQFYDPTKRAGDARLSQSLRDLFTTTREQYISNTDNFGIAHLAYRIALLQRICDIAEEANNWPLALRCCEQAAKEMGGWYVRRRDIRRPQGEAMARLLAQKPGPVDLQDWIREHTRKKRVS